VYQIKLVACLLFGANGPMCRNVVLRPCLWQ